MAPNISFRQSAELVASRISLGGGLSQLLCPVFLGPHTRIPCVHFLRKQALRLMTDGSGSAIATLIGELGEKFLDMTVADICKISVKQSYAEAMLRKFNMFECKAVPTPLASNEKLMKNDGGRKVDNTLYRSIIGSLMYLSAMRPDIMFATSLLSRFMQSPSHIHLGAAKRVLRYIKGTLACGIKYFKGEELTLIGFCDSDWAGSKDDMKNTSGFVFSLGSGVFSWQSKKQEIVVQSLAKAEYISAAIATSQAVWLRRILEDAGENQDNATKLFCDNKSTIAMAKNPIYSSRTRHIFASRAKVLQVQRSSCGHFYQGATQEEVHQIL
ncbi:PREDICTED: uncharacterized protein LOC109243066 [Nicotiana attenuata]|uniref:uncharacterized protein LOC109243066 n=1 Tax=Nicotiana attenuata TaxID=49451 RepID=UPI000905614F|nr:PREDICTED: uncharacterized protein LOC109243066 [Nicotiana attenuata]